MSENLNKKIKNLEKRIFELETDQTKKINEIDHYREQFQKEAHKNREFMSQMIQFIQPFTQRINLIRQASFTSGVKVDFLLEKAYADGNVKEEDLVKFMEEAERLAQEEQARVTKEAQEELNKKKAEQEAEQAKDQENSEAYMKDKNKAEAEAETAAQPEI